MGCPNRLTAGDRKGRQGWGLERSTKRLPKKHQGMSACMSQRSAMCVRCKHHPGGGAWRQRSTPRQSCIKKQRVLHTARCNMSTTLRQHSSNKMVLHLQAAHDRHDTASTAEAATTQPSSTCAQGTQGIQPWAHNVAADGAKRREPPNISTVPTVPNRGCSRHPHQKHKHTWRATTASASCKQNLQPGAVCGVAKLFSLRTVTRSWDNHRQSTSTNDYCDCAVQVYSNPS
jgi:hypothetical protein